MFRRYYVLFSLIDVGVLSNPIDVGVVLNEIDLSVLQAWYPTSLLQVCMAGMSSFQSFAGML